MLKTGVMENRATSVHQPAVFRDGHFASRPVIPLGLEALHSACRAIYPDQQNPLQVTAVVKYWLGGPDPLDYISMYTNAGNASLDISPHWHYISFGLSDLHGDGRVHEISGPESPSGFGFELTFRLKREPGENVPPTWPAAIMQALAKYVFQSENILCPGDHVSWHCPLDNSESRIQHMLLYEDAQLGTVRTPFGSVTFIQIVGVCAEELRAAQDWNGPGVIELMKNVKNAGGPWLVTDMRRGESIFELNPNVQEAVDLGIETEGSNLSGVSAKCFFQEKHFSDDPSDQEGDREPSVPREISLFESEQIKETLKKGLMRTTKPVLPPIRSKCKCKMFGWQTNDKNENHARKESYDSFASDEVPLEREKSSELIQTRKLEGVHMQFNLEAGALLPLALKGRLKHGRHFTFKSVIGDTAITFVSPGVAGAFVDTENRYAVHGPWLQVLITEDLMEKMLKNFQVLSDVDSLILPKTFEFRENKLSITLVQEDC